VIVSTISGRIRAASSTVARIEFGPRCLDPGTPSIWRSDVGSIGAAVSTSTISPPIAVPAQILRATGER
jgi:hypothetical protein